eukprot:m.6424 g.6424  ORF g.6424 m.6424 type:complete len:144 (+) comp2631_c0_seq2:70-501(+)
MAKPPPVGLDYVGWATWEQEATTQSDEDQDRLMCEAAEAAFPGSRPLTGYEFKHCYQKIENLPTTNTSSHFITTMRPGNEGAESAGCASGHFLSCLQPGEQLTGVLPNKYAQMSKRTVICVMGWLPPPADMAEEEFCQSFGIE